MEDMKEAVVTIRMKRSDKFEDQSKWSTGQLKFYHEYFLDNYLHLNKTNIKNYERDIEGIDMELYKTFFITFDSTKLNLFNINNPVKNRPSSRDKGKKEKVVVPICGK